VKTKGVRNPNFGGSVVRARASIKLSLHFI